MSFLEELEMILKKDERFIGEDGRVLKTKVYDACMKLDPTLLKSLLSNDVLKKHFFTDVEGVLVFDKTNFSWVLETKEFLPNSYTMFKNKIGLADKDGSLLASQRDVALVWPYKDCVLEGGQSKEDEKRNEVFYNEILAPDEVTRLLAPKVFTNAKKFTSAGEKDVTELSDNDNLIIKGNNLLVLASLYKRYAGRIKCIYIDPPYYFKDNRDSDTFTYNSSFKLSTWLVFMKNRLIEAKKLLKSGGTIWISIGEDGMHYLKVLADDIFGAEHFVGTIPRRTRNGKSDVPFNFSQDFDWLLVYTNVDDKNQILGRSLQRTYYETEDFPGRKWRLADLTKQTTAKERPNSYFPMIDPKTGKEYPASEKRTWGVSKDTFLDYYKAGAIIFPDDYDFLNITKPYARKFKDEDDASGKLSAVISDFQIQDFLKAVLYECKNRSGNNEIDSLFSREEFDYAKPENLIKAMLEVATEEGDIVLDFFLGSGTTAAVAHKMKRQYIGIEQLDYIQNLSVTRLKAVIEGEQGGVSEEVEWQGGGSFVYCELLERNQVIIDLLIKASTSEEVVALLQKITDNGQVIPSVLPDDIRSNMCEILEFSIPYQKELVMQLINKNRLYLNLNEIDNEDYSVSSNDKAFTRSFYKILTEGGF